MKVANFRNKYKYTASVTKPLLGGDQVIITPEAHLQKSISEMLNIAGKK
jgi:hypothetical protein